MAEDNNIIGKQNEQVQYDDENMCVPVQVCTSAALATAHCQKMASMCC